MKALINAECVSININVKVRDMRLCTVSFIDCEKQKTKRNMIKYSMLTKDFKLILIK